MSELFTVVMPDIGEGVIEGEVIEWLKKVNDPVKQDEPVVVVMTDKATVELPAPKPGKIIKHYYKPGEMAIKDKPLYDIEVGTFTQEAPKSTLEVEAKFIPEIGPPLSAPTATPFVRKMAKEKGIDLREVQGTGKDHHVTEKDLETYSKSLIGVRHFMVKKMEESAKIPQFSFFERVEVTRLIQLKGKLQEKGSPLNIEVTYMPFFIRALSLTCQKFPEMNSSLNKEGNAIIYHPHHNVGIAMATHEGLVVPVLKEVEGLNLEEIIHAYDSIKKKITDQKISPQDMREATISISNFGSLPGHGEWATPLLNPPEVAILALSKIQKQPFVKNDTLTIIDLLNLSWSFDHRIIDGHLASSISHHFCSLLHNPATLLM